MTRQELIQFLNELVELASEENKAKALSVKEKFIGDFERSYEYEKEAEKEVTPLPSHYIAAMPEDVREEIREKVIAALTEAGECTPENIERAMCSKIYDIDDLIDIHEYVRKMEEQQKKKAEQKRGAADDRIGNCSSGYICCLHCTGKSRRHGRSQVRGDTEAFSRERGWWSDWELT